MRLARRNGISRIGWVAVVVVVVLILAVSAAYYAFVYAPPTSTTSSSSTTSSASSSLTSTTTTTSSSSTSNGPSALTWETLNTPQYLDPQIATVSYDLNLLQNLYEPLLWYNGSSSTDIIPWLAQSYTVSPDQSSVNVVLRSGIAFEDGEPFNSTAVYFSFNRFIIEDSSSPVSHGGGFAGFVQQLLNTSLSYSLNGPHKYTQAWAQQVLTQNFVQITGPLTLTLHFQHPSAAWKYLILNPAMDMVAPQYVMQHDLVIWNQTSNGYTLPYAKLTGNMMNKMTDYFFDEVATCDTGATPAGCGWTYLDTSNQGSLAGTGPYFLKSWDHSTSNLVYQANPNYWGGPYQFLGGTKVIPRIQTININNVVSQTTRTIDLENGAKSGQAVTADVTAAALYDVVDRNAWLDQGKLTSIIPGVNVYGPYTGLGVDFVPFASNVSSYLTGSYYKFQPFADVRMRLAFADSVNITEINNDINNRLGLIANNLVPPGLPPAGVYNQSIGPRYSYNLDQAQNLLLAAMMHPLTSFDFRNGTSAPAGYFDNTFGCATLNAKNQCVNPVPQDINLVYASGDPVGEAIMTTIAGNINNISSTYNMGLTVAAEPLAFGQLITEYFSNQLYAYYLGWFADYPWVLDFTAGVYAPGGGYATPDSQLYGQMAGLENQMAAATNSNNITGVIAASNAMNALANRLVLFIWTIYPVQAWTNSAVAAITSNVGGWYYNPGLNGAYFATFYIKS